MIWLLKTLIDYLDGWLRFGILIEKNIKNIACELVIEILFIFFTAGK